ncbi:antitoxin HigA (plasmid) [Marinobacter salarius]|uniref:Antitoxin HigA n=2 Tax=Marinobacter salarius TaxID=1420917 RepID=A0A1W6KFW0_9GAMM|nr:antitoxin HigA [Marinobacter salarius]
MAHSIVKDRDGRIEHPGFILDRFFGRLSVSHSFTATNIGLSRATMHRVCHGKGRVTVDIAKRIEKAFGVPANFFLVQQAAWDLAAIEEDDYLDVKPVADSVISQYALKVVLGGDQAADSPVKSLNGSPANHVQASEYGVS